MKRRVAAVNLGCCQPGNACLLCGPAPVVPEPDSIAALASSLDATDAPSWVGFYGGRPPTDVELEAVQGHPITVRVRPDLLSRADVPRLLNAGVEAIELDVLTVDDRVLRGINRRYRRALVMEQLQGLHRIEVECGAVLAPGLPGSNFTTATEDARVVAPWVEVARLHPVLVLRHSGLYGALLNQAYAPLTMGEAVTVCRAMLDILEEKEVRVLRVGQQAGPDGIGIVAAGPAHPSFRELVEARRTLDTVRAVLREAGWVGDLPPGGHIELRCSPQDVSRTRGPLNQHVRALRAEYGLDEITIHPDPTLPRGHFRVNEKTG
ncbi:MAG: hypothetical protein AB8H79_05445 [Myxococcota bacterium]